MRVREEIAPGATRWDRIVPRATRSASRSMSKRAPDDFEMGYRTQTWLAVSDDPEAAVSGRYSHHRQPQRPAREVSDSLFQDQLASTLAELTSVPLF